MAEVNLADKFIEAIDALKDGDPMPTWDDFYDANGIRPRSRTGFGTAAILKQVMEKRPDLFKAEEA